MASLKNLCKAKANSLLESVLALTIISICLYIAVLIYATVFTPKTSAKFYSSKNLVYESFYLMEISQDSLLEKFNSDSWTITEDIIGKTRHLSVSYRDSLKFEEVQQFYIQN